MRTSQISYPALILTLMVCSCSVEMNQIRETPQVESTPAISSPSMVPVTQVPLTWSHLNLTGKLVFLGSTRENDIVTGTIQILDLATGEIATVLSVPRGWVYYATISSDAKFLAVSYSPPPQSNSPSSRSLYILPLDSSGALQPLLTPPTLDDHYTQAEWSPDGRYIYFVHYNTKNRIEGQLDPVYELFRMNFPDGQPEKISDYAFWPRISSDSSKLVYVAVDPASGNNKLFIAHADGSNSQRVALSGTHTLEIIDAPLFSPNGKSILFSAPEPSQSYQPNFFERLLGIQVARAHNIPSDWWSVPVTGGIPTKLTNIQTINLFASISPDQRHVASLSGEGIFVMDPDGSNLIQLLSDSGVHGTVSWIP